MLKAVMIAGVSLLAFAAAFAASAYRKANDAAPQAEAASEMPPSAASPALGVGGTGTAATPQQAETGAGGEMPVIGRPGPMSAEEVFRLGTTLRNRELSLMKEEEAFKQEKTRMRLISEDIRSEQQVLDGIRSQIQAEMKAAEELLAQIIKKGENVSKERDNAKDELEKFKEAQIEFQQGEQENIKRISQWFQSMEPEKAAEYLRELSDGGQMETAVQLLANFEEREAAKILAAMNDPTLVVQLAEKFKGLKRPQKEKVRR